METLLRDLSRVVLADRALGEVLEEITRIASRGIPGAEATSITLLRGDKALHRRLPRRRWRWTPTSCSTSRATAPAWTPAAAGWSCGSTTCAPRSAGRTTSSRTAAIGVRSSLSVPLPYQGGVIGALNNYSTEPAAFASPESLEAGIDVAEVVAVAVANAEAHHQLGEQAKHLRIAMESRAVIEQAKGVLMAQQGVDTDQAFEILRMASQRANRKLRDVALGVVASTQQPRD